MAETSEWESLDWLSSARTLVEWTAAIDLKNPIALVVRHSHRATLADYKQMVTGGLTELGKRTSFELGKRLPTKRFASVFTSFVPRCAETAEYVRKGFTDAGGSASDIESLGTLFGPEYSEEKVWGNLQPDGRNVTEFVNKWADGQLGEGIEPFDRFQSRLHTDTVSRLVATRDSAMHIHVTHDLSLMSLKRSLLGRPLTVLDREPYLGGIGLVPVARGISVFTASTRQVLELKL